MSNTKQDDQINLRGCWVFAPLEEICQINPPLDRCIVDDAVEVNFVPMRAVEPEGGGLVRPELRSYGKVKKGYTPFLSGDVIMAKITPCMENGKTTVVPELPGSVCFGSTEFHVMRPEDGVAPRWVSSFLLQHETRRSAQRAMTGGVGQMRVPGAFLEAVRIPVAPSAEQERIVDALDELFSDLDAGVAAMERVRHELKLYRAAVLKAAVEGALTAEWRRQNPQTEPASELLKRTLAERRRRWEEEQLCKFKEKGHEPPNNWKAKYKEPLAPNTADLPALPDGWCWASIGQLTTVLENGFGKRAQLGGTPRIVLRLADVTNGEISYEQTRRINCTADDVNKYGLVENDLLILRVNGSADLVGRFVLVRATPEQPLFCDHFIRARCVFESSAAWLRTYADTDRFRRYIDLKKVSSAGQNTISQGTLMPVVVPVPPVLEQEAIAETVQSQLSIIDHLEADSKSEVSVIHATRPRLKPEARA
jgi:type I restriction enzyme S subunit